MKTQRFCRARARTYYAAGSLVLAASTISAQVTGNTAAPVQVSKLSDRTAARGTVHGRVLDPLGAAVAGARVELLSGETVVASAVADGSGFYQVSLLKSGDFRLRSGAASFEPSLTSPRYFSAGASTAIDLTVATPTDTEQITVTATGTPTPIAQVAGSVTVLNDDQFSHVRDLQEPLRYVSGVQITQTGQAGGTTGLRIRGSNTNASKVVIDGISVNDLGGAAEFANIASAGIARIEVLREPDSALYGSDALAGVVSFTTRRGGTPLPLIDYEGDAGNFHTYRQEASVSGASHRFDYFLDGARQDTGNNLPNDEFHNATFADNVGFQPNATTDLRFTFRHVSAEGGKPNATALYGIPDSAFSTEHDLVIGGTLDSRTTDRWHNVLRYGGLRLNYQYNKLALAGIPVYTTSKGVTSITSYLGAPVTIVGANGYKVSGQATLNFNPSSLGTTTNRSQRDFVYGQTDYRLDGLFGANSHTLLLAGFTYTDERGTGISSTPANPNPAYTPVERGNYSTALEIKGDAAGRFFYTVGTGLEDNAVYGFAATPRGSAAYYLVRPSNNSFLNGTKLHTSFSKGIKGPSIYIQQHSLYSLILPTNPTLVQQDNIAQVGAEQARSYDGGVDQEIGHGRARIGATYFHNEYGNGLEFVSQANLIATGFADASNTAINGGAYVNSLAYRTQGLEVEIESKLGAHLFARGGYTLTDGTVQRSFASSALKPSINPLFPGIPIGTGPLVGGRPFRVARNSGYFGLQYTRSRWNAQLNGTLVGFRDDSDFLSGNLILPNHNLDGQYQRLELTGEYRVSHHLSAYVEAQNLLSERYTEAFGYPALPFNFRSGLRVSFGGESWKLK